MEEFFNMLSEQEEPPTEAVAAGPLAFLHAETPDEIDPAMQALAERTSVKNGDDPLVQALATAMCREHLEGWGKTEDLPNLYLMLRRVQAAAELAIEYVRDAGVDQQIQAAPMELDGYTLSYNTGGERVDLKKLKEMLPRIKGEDHRIAKEYLDCLDAAEAESKYAREILKPIAKRVGATSPARASIALTRKKGAGDER